MFFTNFLLKLLFCSLFILVNANYVFAFEPEKQLENKEQEQRAYKIFRQIRCLTCKGQAIESSSSDFALDIRNFVRKEIVQGKTDIEIFNKLTEIFGPEIIDNKKPNIYNAIFWLAVFSSAFVSFWLFANYYRKNRQ